MNYNEVMQRLNDEGFENCHGDGHNQIIVNNRGEIDFLMDKAMIYDRYTAPTGYTMNKHTDIDTLFEEITDCWPKKEPK